MNYKQLHDFISFVQNFHPAVKFTYEISEESIAFLDMDISLKQGKLTTSVHYNYKATDCQSYLDYCSSHNPSTKNSIPFSQCLKCYCWGKKNPTCFSNSLFNFMAYEP